MELLTILYVLLGLSTLFNILLLLRIKYLRDEIRELKGGVELSKEELNQLKNRLSILKSREIE